MNSIFVAKLDFGVSDEELRDLFQQYGTVIKSHIAKDKETGKPRGFAFVEMSNSEEVQNAINGLNGHTINGRSIVVKEAEDRGNNRQKDSRRPSSPRPNQQRESRPQNSRPPRAEHTESGMEQAPFALPQDDTSSSSSEQKRTKRGKGKKKKGGESSENREMKMSAYKKSGKKKNFHFEDDDDDWEMELLRSKKRGWVDEEDED
jgi:RNA recognition motif-containing protein